MTYRYEKLEIWQLSIQLFELWQTMRIKYPKHELYKLVDQLDRAIEGIGSTIVEGSAHRSRKEFARYVDMSRGSALESRHHFFVSFKKGYITQEEVAMINSIIEKLYFKEIAFQKWLLRAHENESGLAGRSTASRVSSASSGQIVLIGVLVLAIATTIALSLIARTTTDLRITTQTEESARAFSAAEAGIEQAIQTGIVGGTQPIMLESGSYADVTTTLFGQGSGPFTIPKKVSRITGETIFFVPHADDGTLALTPAYSGSTVDVCWSKETVVPGVAIALWYKDGSDYKISRAAFDPDATRASTNGFTAVGALGAGCGQSSVYSTTLTLSDYGIVAGKPLVFMRIRPVYDDAIVTILTGGDGLPAQGKKFESLGVTSGKTNRKVIVYQDYQAPPFIADFGLYSGNDIIQN